MLAKQDRKSTLEGMGYGMYQCYCGKYAELLPLLTEKDLCYTYQVNQQDSIYFSGMISFSVVSINIVLRIVGTHLISKIGHWYNDD